MNKNLKKQIQAQLKETEKELNIKIPADLYTFIQGLEKPQQQMGENPDEEWEFGTLYDEEYGYRNFITECSKDFKSEWGLDALVFAKNIGGDYLLLLPGKKEGTLEPAIYAMMHEVAELRYFATDLRTALEKGPLDYMWCDSFYLRLEEDGTWTKGEDSLDKPQRHKPEETRNDEAQLKEDYQDYELRQQLDEWIDAEDGSKITELVTGLEHLAEHPEQEQRIWALNKLSDLYMKGFDPLPKNTDKALAYNQQAMDLGSYKAFSNRAACYFSGKGLQRDLNKALESAKRANELAKQDPFASQATEPGTGMYDSLISFIEKQIREEKSSMS